MRAACIVGLSIAALSASGCDRTDGAEAPGHHSGGRYQGIGIYSADPMWSKLAGKEADQDGDRALRTDDGEIIVVVDSQTGEIRQCGNLSGYCVTMNPWARALENDRSAPLAVSKHAADLANETVNTTDQSTNDAVATKHPSG